MSFEKEVDEAFRKGKMPYERAIRAVKKHQRDANEISKVKEEPTEEITL